MKERPIVFSGPMVNAILDGRKTQTRRVVKPQPPADVAPIRVEMFAPTIIDRWGDEDAGPEIFGAYDIDGEWGVRCPYGQPGDRLWVREACKAHELTDKEAEELAENDINYDGYPPYGLDGVQYLADGSFVPIDNTFEDGERWGDLRTYRNGQGLTVPPIHMPRWASRITLEITGVRVERLQDISEQDCEREIGATLFSMTDEAYPHFRNLWEAINGPGSWAANPWVWVVEFKRIEK